MEPTVDSFWEEFQTEAEEHVATADRLLDLAMSDGLGPEEVAELFRAFHSVKGLARVMGLTGLETVAHWAESLLGLVRDGGAALDRELLEGLGLAVGELGQMMTGIVRDRSDVPAPDDLVARLLALHADRGGAAPAAGGELSSTAGAEESGGSMIALLAELMAEFLPGIAGLAAPSLDADAASGPADAVTALANAAEVMEMPELGEILGGFAEFAGGAGEDTAGLRLGLLVRLGQQAALVGEIAGAEAGCEKFAAALAGIAGALLRTKLEALTPSGAGEVAALLDAIGHGRAARLAALAGEAGVSREDAAASPRLIQAIQAALDVIARPWRESGSVPADLDEADLKAHADEIRAALALPGHPAPVGGVAGLAIPAEFLPVLSQENRRDLERAAGDGQLIYQLLVDLDAAELEESETGGFLDRLAEIGRSVTSRTVPQGERNWFEMLVVSPLSLPEMQDSLALLDPERRWVKTVRLAGDAEASPGPVAEAAVRGGPERAVGAAEPAAGDALVLRVRSAALDRLMAAVGDARVAAAALSQTLGQDRRKAEALAGLMRLRDRLPSAVAAELGGYLDALRERETDLADLDGRLSTSLSQLHADALDLRVVPVETVLARLPRIARDLAQRQNKLVHIRIEGREVRIDKSVVQQLLDPLMHMMRNAVDHGIEAPAVRRAAGKPETATITLRALQRASEFHLEVIDDGCGLDAEAIRAKAVARGLIGEAESHALGPDRIHRFIFEPGFSTAAAITETSGRGVGMDVVMHTLGRLGGRMDIRTERGLGTTFVMILPLSAAVLPALLVEVRGQCLAIPERSIATVEEIGSDRVRQAGGRRVLLRGNLALPLHPLAALLGMAASGQEGHAVVVASGPASIALSVDRLLRRQELLLRDLHPALAALPGVGGAALLGDGSPVLVLDADALIELARGGRRGRAAQPAAAS